MPIGGWSWTVYRYPGGISRNVGPSLDVSSLTPVSRLFLLSLLCVQYILCQESQLVVFMHAQLLVLVCCVHVLFPIRYSYRNKSCYRVVMH